MGTRRVAIMQPYFFPYIGYFHLMDSADTFVLYDNLQYTKRGWINRNRYLRSGSDATFTIPLRKASDYLNIDDREVASEFDRGKVLNRIREAYRRAPFFDDAFAVFSECLAFEDKNLFRFIRNSLDSLRDHLEIATEIMTSSAVDIDHSLTSEEKVLAICEELSAGTYINAIGGTDLYSPSSFAKRGIALRFIKSDALTYKQFDDGFVPWLSILDVMMFNSRERVIEIIRKGYSLVEHAAAA